MVWPAPKVRAVFASQSLPTANDKDPAAFVVSETLGAPLAAAATAEAPAPPAPDSASTSSCWPYFWPSVEVTAKPGIADATLAVQISLSPSWAFSRCTRVQVRPPPLTVAVWPPPLDPSLAMKASRDSPAGTAARLAVAVPVP